MFFCVSTAFGSGWLSQAAEKLSFLSFRTKFFAPLRRKCCGVRISAPSQALGAMNLSFLGFSAIRIPCFGASPRRSEISAAKNQRSAHPGESNFRKHSCSVPAFYVDNCIRDIFDAAFHPLSLDNSRASVRLDSYNGIGQVRFPTYYAISDRYVSTFQLHHPRHLELSRTSFERSRRESAQRQRLVYCFRLLVASIRSHKNLVGFLPEIVLLNHQEREPEFRQFLGRLVRPHPMVEFADLQKLFRRCSGALLLRLLYADKWLGCQIYLRNGGPQHLYAWFWSGRDGNSWHRPAG